jgi:hypothetical protein
MISGKFILCFVVAVVLRLGLVFWAGAPVDQEGYGPIAQSVRARQYTDVTRGPVYPVFLAVAGAMRVAQLLQALLDALTGYLVYRLADRRLWAAWLWALYPLAIWQATRLNPAVWLAFLMAGYACLQVNALRSQHLRDWFVAGIFLGLVNLCQPILLLWPVAVLFLAPWRRVAVLAAGMLLLVIPWTLRNYRVTRGEIVPVATEHRGLMTFAGNYQGAGDWLAAAQEIAAQPPSVSDAQLDRRFYRAAGQQIAGNPWNTMLLLVRKCGRFWWGGGAGLAIAQTLWLVVIAVGLWRAWPWPRATALLVTLALWVMALQVLTNAEVWHCLPVMPALGALAVLGIDRRAGGSVS